MDVKTAAMLFETLASEVRLNIFRLLVRHAPDGLVVGEIGEIIQIPATTLSFHLKTIARSGLIEMEKEGRFLRYRANLPLMNHTIAFLTEECCRGHA